MNDYMIEELYPSENLEQAWVEIREGQLPPVAWDGLRARLRRVTREEQLGEFLFVLATFTLWSWYMFWLYEALQNSTIVPLP